MREPLPEVNFNNPNYRHFDDIVYLNKAAERSWYVYETHKNHAKIVDKLTGRKNPLSKLERRLASKALEAQFESAKQEFKPSSLSLGLVHAAALREDYIRDQHTLAEKQKLREEELEPAIAEIYGDAKADFDRAVSGTEYEKMAPYDKALFVYEYLADPKHREKFPFISMVENGKIRIQGNSLEATYLISVNEFAQTTLPIDIILNKPEDGLVEIDFYERPLVLRSSNYDFEPRTPREAFKLQNPDRSTDTRRDAFLLAAKQATDFESPLPAKTSRPGLKAIISEQLGVSLLRWKGHDVALPPGTRYFIDGEEVAIDLLGYKDVSKHGGVNITNLIFGLRN